MVGDRGVAGPRAAIRRDAPVEAGRSDRDVAATRRRYGRRGGGRHRMAASHRARHLLGHSEEEARADDCLGQGGTRPRLPHRWPHKCMNPAINSASARQHAGEPALVPGRGGDRRGSGDAGEVQQQIAELVDRSTQDLRVAWRQLHRAGPPLGLSRDLIIRALAHQLQEQTHGGMSRAQRRRLQTLAREFEKAAAAFAPGVVPNTGTRLVRQWRGRTHAVLVREDGYEYEGERYRSLTVIAERITGAHWSGPRFFGLTKRAGILAGAEAGP